MNIKNGSLLVELGLISAQQLAECAKNTKQTRKHIIETVVAHNFTTYHDIAHAFAKHASLPLIETIDEKMTDLALLAKIPLPFLRNNVVMPVIKNGTLFIVIADPMNFQVLDDVNILLAGKAAYAVAPYDVIIAALNKYYPLHGTQEMLQELADEKAEEVAFEEIDQKDILSMASQAPIIKLVNNILFQAVKGGASDIHIEPFEKDIQVRYRIDGVMHEVMSPPKRIQDALISRLKIMSQLDIAEKRIPQDGRIAIKVADKAIDIRVSILPVAHGERIVMRLLDKSKTFAALTDLNLNERNIALLQKVITQPNGIIYVTGPTGSGKTTTLYSILAEINRPDVTIITVEDPVEYQMKGIGQVQVREKVGLTFATALRSILRQDPDIIMIGETRDQETAQIAIQAALTGHLVLSTLHTNSAPAAITRLIDMGVEPFLIASSVIVAIAQRLVRRLCNACKKEYTPNESLLLRIGLRKKTASSITFYEPVGCDACGNTGYKGRVAIFELMEMTPAIISLTMNRADTNTIQNQAKKDGMTLLIEDGIHKIKEGITTIEEVLSVAAIDHEVIT